MLRTECSQNKPGTDAWKNNKHMEVPNGFFG